MRRLSEDRYPMIRHTASNKAKSYIRVTNFEQDPSSQIAGVLHSDDAQESRDTGVFIDQGRSGRNDRRPAWQRLKRTILAHPGATDILYVWNLDRMDKNTSNLKRDLALFKAAGVKVKSISQPDLSPRNLKAEMASIQHQSDRISRDIKRAKSLQKQAGGFLGKAPYGYQLKPRRVSI